MNKTSFIPDRDNVNSMITGGEDRWVNGIGWNNVFDILSGGAFSATEAIRRGDGDSAARSVLMGGWASVYDDTGTTKALRSKKQIETDNWNAKDPLVLFPLPENPTCENMRELRDKLVLEQASAQHSYGTKVTKYIQEIDDALAKNDCEKQLLDQESYDQAERSINVAKMGLGVNTQGSVSSMTPMSIALIAGSVLFVGVVAIILVRSSGSKSS